MNQHTKQTIVRFLPLIVGLGWLLPALIALVLSLRFNATAPYVVIFGALTAFGLYRLLSAVIRFNKPVSTKAIVLDVNALFIVLGVLCVNGIFSGRRARIDMTENETFTISETTLDIIKSTPAPVRLVWYLSDYSKLPPKYRTLRRATVDYLDQLDRETGDRFSYEIVDPSSNEDLVGVLKRQGIAMSQHLEQSLEGQETRYLWSTMVMRSADLPEQVIPYYDDARELEYQIASGALRLSNPVKPRIGVMLPPAGKPIPGLTERFKPKDYYSSLLMKHVSGRFELIGIDPDASQGLPLKSDIVIDRMRADLKAFKIEIPAPVVDGEPLVTERGCGEYDIDALILIKPGRLESRWEYEVERFLASGGSVILFQSGIDVEFNEYSRTGPTLAHARVGFKELLDSLGIGIGEKLLFGAEPLIMQTPVYRLQLPCVHFIKPRDMDREHPATSRQPLLIMPFPTPLLLDEEKLSGLDGIQYKTLFSSGPKSAIRDFDKPEISTALFDQRSMFDFYGKPVDETEATGGKPLAIALSGKMPWRWANGNVPPWRVEPDQPVPVPPLTSMADGHLTIVASSEFLNDPYFLAPYNVGVDAVHGQFVLQLLESQLTARQLGDIRLKQIDHRPLKELVSEKFSNIAIEAWDPKRETVTTLLTDSLYGGGAGRSMLLFVGKVERDSLFRFNQRLSSDGRCRILQIGDGEWFNTVAIKRRYAQAESNLTPTQRAEFTHLKTIPDPDWALSGAERMGAILRDKYFYLDDVREPFYLFVDERGDIAFKGELLDESSAAKDPKSLDGALEKLAGRINAYQPRDLDSGIDPVLSMQIWMSISVPLVVLIIGSLWYGYRLIRRARYNRKFGL